MLSENAVRVLESRYLLPGETPNEMFTRVANALASAEEENLQSFFSREFFEVMSTLKFLPNSPTLMNAGTGQGSGSACFVIPVEDSMEGIMEAAKVAALVQKYGGGTGFSLSRIRPKGQAIKTTQKHACGPIAVLKHLDSVSQLVTQGGKREGANMGILHWAHDDIEEFITIKSNVSRCVACKEKAHSSDSYDHDYIEDTILRNFNISVGVDEDFFLALRSGDPKANRLWDLIAENAHANGDPGLVFLDLMNEGRSNPVPKYGPIEATNPCGEQPLYPFDSCNLGSINLAAHVKDGKFDYNELEHTINTAVRMLDNVIDVNIYADPRIEAINKDIRRIGLGVMGFADTLFELGIPYGTKHSFTVAGEIASTIQNMADAASAALAVEKGAFPAFKDSIYANGVPLRNSTRTTIAPTGSISIIAGVSGGIEPVFALGFTRRHKIDKGDKGENLWAEMSEINPVLMRLADDRGLNTEEFKTDIASGTPLRRYAEYFTADEIKTFVTSAEVSIEAHIQMQAVWQKNVDNAVSKTINLPEDATVDQVKQAYLLARNLGCKGITIYRDGSRSMQVLSKANTSSSNQSPKNVGLERRELSTERESRTIEFRVGEHKGYFTVGHFEEGTPGELFITMSKTGSTERGLYDAVGLLTSMALQYGVPVEKLTSKFVGTQFEPSGFTGDQKYPFAKSPLDYVFRWLHDKYGPAVHQSGISSVVQQDLLSSQNVGNCPECVTGDLIRESGCTKCMNCGYSKC